MSVPTDPARELADLCHQLSEASGDRGDDYLARRFSVPKWSAEFYQILFAINHKADFLIKTLQNTELDEDYRNEIAGHIENIKLAFSPSALNAPWTNAINHYIGPTQVGPVKILSGLIRNDYPLVKLNDEEISELIGEVDELLSWLREHQLQSADFIRQALIEGLTSFRFRLERIGWLGSGYVLASLKEVIAAYMALERGIINTNSDPIVASVLKKTQSYVNLVYEKTQSLKNLAETSDFVLKWYGAAELLLRGKQSIAGLLTGP